ncbi:TPM domain-containing protein [Methylolobus aquaticus]
MALKRILKHLWFPDWTLRRRFPAPALRTITAVIGESERGHSGEICFAVEASLSLDRLARGQSARGRALELFSLLRVWDTEHNNGVLIYVLLADRDVEILADRGIARCAPQERWAAICDRMEEEFRAGRFVDGALAGIREVGGELRTHFAGEDRQGDELPNEPHLLF